MKSLTSSHLHRYDLALDAGEDVRLTDLQRAFAAACDHVASIARVEGVYGRVRLHHVAYEQVRAAFPTLGAQHACNAIYAVSKAMRTLCEAPGSPIRKRGAWQRNHDDGGHGSAPNVPIFRFSVQNPVYFDRNSLTIHPSGNGTLAALSGRAKFRISEPAELLQLLKTGGCREIALHRQGEGPFYLEVWTKASASHRASSAEIAPVARVEAMP